MSAENIAAFIRAACDQQRLLLDLPAVSEIAARHVPDVLFGWREAILRADIASLWARWFVESICDPVRLAAAYKSYGHVYAEVLPHVRQLFAATPDDERRRVATAIASALDNLVRRQLFTRRATISRAERELLWDLARPTPRCSVCGYLFSEEAAEKFLKLSEANPPLPMFVDFATGHGMTERDLCVEIDHVLPVFEGGQSADNLRITCGWCNVHKSTYLSLYDVDARPIRISHPTIGPMSIPQPFWAVRLISLRARCEWEDGCSNTSSNCQLLLAPRRLGGAMNPANLRVVCPKHDPLGHVRFIGRERFSRI